MSRNTPVMLPVAALWMLKLALLCNVVWLAMKLLLLDVQPVLSQITLPPIFSWVVLKLVSVLVPTYNVPPAVKPPSTVVPAESCSCNRWRGSDIAQDGGYRIG